MLAVMSSTNAQGLVVKERSINGNKTAVGFVGKCSINSPHMTRVTHHSDSERGRGLAGIAHLSSDGQWSGSDA